MWPVLHPQYEKDDWKASTVMGSVPISSDLLALSYKPTFIASLLTTSNITYNIS